MVAWLIPARWKGEEATGPLEERRNAIQTAMDSSGMMPRPTITEQGWIQENRDKNRSGSVCDSAWLQKQESVAYAAWPVSSQPASSRRLQGPLAASHRPATASPHVVRRTSDSSRVQEFEIS